MNAFDHFQEATCDISERNLPAAIKHLDAAIANGLEAWATSLRSNSSWI